jgi:hypothetical protein
MATTIPKKDADFNVRQEVITTAAMTNESSWGLDTMWMETELVPKKMKWVEAWAAYTDPMGRTPLITFAKTEARNVYEPALRTLVQNLEHNTRVTNEERAAMGIVIPSKNRKPLPLAGKYPAFKLDSSVIRCLGVDFQDFDSPSRAKPHGVHGAEIRWAILDAAPASVNELVHSNFDTRTPYVLQFEENERGKTVYFCLRWESNTGEKGPWSEIVSAIIP